MVNINLTRNINKRLVKPLVRRFDQYQDYHEHKLSALRAIKLFEESNSQKLSPHHKKLADEYAQDVFGTKEYAPWLYFYSLVRGEFLEGWIPDNYFGRYIAPNQGLSIVSIYKTFSEVIFKTELIPDLAYYIDGLFYTPKLIPIDSVALQKSLHSCYPELIVKEDKSNKGKAIHRISSNNVNQETFSRYGNCVIQQPIVQHNFFEKIVHGPITSIRILTTRNPEGKIEFKASCLNLGRRGDGWTIAGKTILVAVLDLNGALDSVGYGGDWRKWHFHPDTQFVFEGKKTPYFTKAVETCINLHSLVPHFKAIGWDTSITEDGHVKVMEWNAVYPGIKFHEATAGPCFHGLNWESLWRNNR